MTKTRKKPRDNNQMPCWVCECGNQEIGHHDDRRVVIGTAIFRKPGCKRCHRPIQLAGTFCTAAAPEKP